MEMRRGTPAADLKRLQKAWRQVIAEDITTERNKCIERCKSGKCMHHDVEKQKQLAEVRERFKVAHYPLDVFTFSEETVKALDYYMPAYERAQRALYNVVTEEYTSGKLADPEIYKRFLLMLAFSIHEYKAATVTDFGCGNGLEICALARIFPNIRFTGVDISDVALDMAEERRRSHNLQNVSFHLLNETPLPAATDYVYGLAIVADLTEFDAEPMPENLIVDLKYSYTYRKYAMMRKMLKANGVITIAQETFIDANPRSMNYSADGIGKSRICESDYWVYAVKIKDDAYPDGFRTVLIPDIDIILTKEGFVRDKRFSFTANSGKVKTGKEELTYFDTYTAPGSAGGQ